MTTGSELFDLSLPLTPARIYDSNIFGLAAAAEDLVTDVKSYHVSDKPEKLREMTMHAMVGDVVVTSGGVSVGDHDLVKEELERWEVTRQFWKVAIKPGKPLYFGTQGQKLIFGLPGNPVSALVTFALFVRPAILKRMGHPNPWSPPCKARFNGRVTKKAGRTEFLRGHHSDDGVRSLEGQGSHQLATLAEANCLIVFPAEAEYLEDGGSVSVIPLDWATR
jgi:molybdopterin molybdotransferase